MNTDLVLGHKALLLNVVDANNKIVLYLYLLVSVTLCISV